MCTASEITSFGLINAVGVFFLIKDFSGWTCCCSDGRIIILCPWKGSGFRQQARFLWSHILNVCWFSCSVVTDGDKHTAGHKVRGLRGSLGFLWFLEKQSLVQWFMSQKQAALDRKIALLAWTLEQKAHNWDKCQSQRRVGFTVSTLGKANSQHGSGSPSNQ